MEIDELRQYLGLVGFYRKFIPFSADTTVCQNKMLGKGTTFKWTKHCKNVLKLLKLELVKMPALQYQNPNKQFKLFTDASKYSHSGILHQEKRPNPLDSEPNLISIAYFSEYFS